MTQEILKQALEHHHAGRLKEAKDLYRRILSREPRNVVAMHHLGVIAMQAGHPDIAIDLIGKAISLRPDYAEAYNSLGSTFLRTKRLEQASDAFRQAVAIQGDYAEAHNNLGISLRERGQLDEAIESYRRSIQTNPRLEEVFNNLGTALRERGDLDDSIEAYRNALAVAPQFSAAHSNLILTMQTHSGIGAQDLLEEHQRWNRVHAEPFRSHARPHGNEKDPDRPLRVGYVSPDLRNHVIGRSVLPLLQRHDRGLFFMAGYAELTAPDAVSERIRTECDLWRNTTGLSHEKLANQIREDRIDILVDLALHTPKNRLLTFAAKPAPVQVTYLGYCGTTGLRAMDYRLSDVFLDPPGTDLSQYSEETLHLESSYWCYQAPEMDVSPGPLPSLARDSVTFGCLNHFAKVSEDALDLWAQVLLAVQDSRLLLHAPPGKARDRTLVRLAMSGIDPDRIEFVGAQPFSDYLRTYQRVDISLDTLPYGGGITSCDSLWMGVPVVTLAGARTPMSRSGCSILGTMGLSDFVAVNPQRYVSIAAEAAGNLRELALLRQTLRERMDRSPLTDWSGHTKSIETAFRKMWRQWCESGASS